MRGRAAAVVKAAITLVLFQLLFRNFSFDQLLHTVSGGSAGLLLAAFALVWAGHCLCILRWRLLLHALGLRLPAPRLVGVYCVGLCFNLALPTLVGGDVARIYYAGKSSGSYVRSFTATYLDRSTGVLAMMTVAVAATLAPSLELPGVPVRALVWSASTAFSVFNLALFVPRVHAAFTGVLTRLGYTRAAARLDTVSRAFLAVRGRIGSLLAALALSLANQILVVLMVWLVSTGLGLRVGPGSYFLVVPVVALVTMIPVSLGGMGLREHAFVGALAGLGVAPAEAAAIGLICSSFLVLSAIPGGMIYVFLRSRGDVVRMNTLETNLS